MTVDYNNFAKTFSNSRKSMKWEEIEYFLSFLEGKGDFKILDIGCGNGRFLSHLKTSPLAPLLIGEGNNNYLGVDLSEMLLEEASIFHPEARFLHLDMLNLNSIKDKFDCIFFLASFHHLDSVEKRLEVLKKAYDLLEDSGTIFMTNWSLNSELNKRKYEKSIVTGSENTFGSLDYSVKIGEYTRYYHCFSLSELEYLFKESGFSIIENREFENKKNFISIIQKNN